MQSVVKDARTDERVEMDRLWPVLVYETRPAELPRAVVLLDGRGENAAIVAIFRQGELVIVDEEQK